ncbi:MAG: hypothetical protein V4773_27640 [Verrucomicrobiota bacterium]
MISPNEPTAAEPEGQVMQDVITGMKRLFKFGERVVVTVQAIESEMIVAVDDRHAGFLLDPQGHPITPMITDRVVIEFTKVLPGKGEWRIVERAP